MNRGLRRTTLLTRPGWWGNSGNVGLNQRKGARAMNGKARNLSVLLAIGAMSLGVAACGSSSGSSSGSTSASAPSAAEATVAADVIKEASVYRRVQLTIKNDTSPANDPDSGPWFYVCFTL